MASADRLVELFRRTTDSAPDAAAAAADAVVDAWMDADAYRLYVLGTALRALDGQPMGAESSANKLFWSQLDVAIHQTALSLLGERATLTGDAEAAQWLDGYQFSLAGPIYAGTNEVQRNLVAERVLGLPRG
jgi:alkylation response protein AidB-like acyl-CoA dehydrogenase